MQKCCERQGFLSGIGHAYMRHYVTILMSYSDVAHHYGNVALAGKNRDTDTPVQ